MTAEKTGGCDATPAGYRQVRFVRPPDGTEIVLVRHGETIPAPPDDPFPLVEGQGDPDLGPEGIEQAARLADRLAGTEIAAIYVTTLRRTAQTAAPLARGVGLEPKVERDLREVHLGEWEGGIYRKKVIDGDPLALQVLEQERWDVIPGAESNEAFAERVRRGLSNIARAHVGERVVVVSHGGTIAMALSLASGSRPFAFIAADNAGISTIVVTPADWVIRSFNDTAHLSRPAARVVGGALLRRDPPE